MLCDLLKSTQLLGDPKSFYRPQSIDNWKKRLSIEVDQSVDLAAFERTYLQKILIAGRGGTDRFSMRIMQANLQHMMSKLALIFPDEHDDRSLINKAFGGTKFLYLERLNKIEQAISYYRAEQSGLWHKFANGDDRERELPQQTEPTYNFQKISKLVHELEIAEIGWQQWFKGANIAYVHITYEALSDDPKTVMASTLKQLELDLSCTEFLSFDTSKLADNLSHKWAQRFLEDQQKAEKNN